MKREWKTFLQRVWGDAKGWAFLAYRGAGQFKQKAYAYPGQLDILLDDAMQYNKWADIYFCPHLFTIGKERKKEHTAKVTALWVDKDSGPESEIVPRPTICWRTSEGRHQAVWILKEPADPTEAEQVNKFLTYRSKADKGGWHLGKVIRFPWSINHKYTPAYHGTVLWSDGPLYDLAELSPKPLEETVVAVAESLPTKVPDKIPTITDALLSYGKKVPRAAWDILSASPAEAQDWSETLWKLERLLAEAGLPPEVTFVIVQHSPWNKYGRDKRPDEHLWHEIYKAYQDQGPIPEDPKTLPWTTMDRLLTHAERPCWLVEDCWMKSNVGWIVGVGKSYKSTISLDLALSVASGHPFLGKYEVLDPGPVLMVQEEDPMWRVAHRVQVMSQAKGISMTTLTEDKEGLTLQIRQNKRIPLFISVGGGFIFKNEEKIYALEAAIDQYRPKLVILDPFFMLCPGMDEYKAGDITPALNQMKAWRNTYGCSVAVIHHYRKGGNGDLSERLYGSMALYAWSENSFFMERVAGSNRVILTRDIKDAEAQTPLAIDVRDIDEDYIIDVSDKAPLRVDTIPAVKPYHKVDCCLRQLSLDATFTVGSVKDYIDQHLSPEGPISESTVVRRINRLERLGIITATQSGEVGKRKRYHFLRPMPDHYQLILELGGDVL